MFVAHYFAGLTTCEVRIANINSATVKHYLEMHHKIYPGFDDRIIKHRFAVINGELKGDRSLAEQAANEVIVASLMDRFHQKKNINNEKVVVVPREMMPEVVTHLRRKCMAFYKTEGQNGAEWDPETRQVSRANLGPEDTSPFDMVY